MVDLFDFRLSPKMHIKIKVSWDSYQNIMECVRVSRNCNCAIFMSCSINSCGKTCVLTLYTTVLILCKF